MKSKRTMFTPLATPCLRPSPLTKKQNPRLAWPMTSSSATPPTRAALTLRSVGAPLFTDLDRCSRFPGVFIVSVTRGISGGLVGPCKSGVPFRPTDGGDGCGSSPPAAFHAKGRWWIHWTTSEGVLCSIGPNTLHCTTNSSPPKKKNHHHSLFPKKR
jgi:hypothetical protein